MAYQESHIHILQRFCWKSLESRDNKGTLAPHPLFGNDHIRTYTGQTY